VLGVWLRNASLYVKQIQICCHEKEAAATDQRDRDLIFIAAKTFIWLGFGREAIL
jgi:hypothetical protein